MNVLILGAKPVPASPACQGSVDILSRLGRIEKCLEEIEKALAERLPGTARKASESTARARTAGAGEAAKTPPARKAKA